MFSFRHSREARGNNSAATPVLSDGALGCVSAVSRPVGTISQHRAFTSKEQMFFRTRRGRRAGESRPGSPATTYYCAEPSSGTGQEERHAFGGSRGKAPPRHPNMPCDKDSRRVVVLLGATENSPPFPPCPVGGRLSRVILRKSPCSNGGSPRAISRTRPLPPTRIPTREAGSSCSWGGTVGRPRAATRRQLWRGDLR